jgi:hypothetical protein
VKLKSVRGKNLILLSLMLTLALLIGACGDNEPEVVEEPVVVEEEPVVVEEEATPEAEVVVEEEAEVVATAVVTDTGMITETEVTTETDVIEVITETMVITDTSIVDTETEVESEVITETAELTETAESAQGAALAIVIITDTTGVEFLGDETSQQPLFASDQEGMVEDERFEPVMVSEDTNLDPGLDANLFGETELDGNRILTVNDRPVYRFVGEEGEDWRTAAAEVGLSPLTAQGELGEAGE